METLRERFDRNVKAKATIGDPFTLDDIAHSLQVPVTDLRPSWFTPFVNSDTIRKVGMKPSRNPKSNGRLIALWQGTYYINLEDEERREFIQQNQCPDHPQFIIAPHGVCPEHAA